MINNDKEVTHPLSGSSSIICLVELEFRELLVFDERGKTGVPGEKPLEEREKTNNNLKPYTARRWDLNPDYIENNLNKQTNKPLSMAQSRPEHAGWSHFSKNSTYLYNS